MRNDFGRAKPPCIIVLCVSTCTEQIPVMLSLLPSFQSSVGFPFEPPSVPLGRTTGKRKLPDVKTRVGSLVVRSQPIKRPSIRTNAPS